MSLFRSFFPLLTLGLLLLGTAACRPDCDNPEDVGYFVQTEFPTGINEFLTHYLETPQQNGLLDSLGGTLTTGSVRLIVTDNQTLRYLQWIELWLTAPGKPDFQIAYRDDVPENTGGVLDLIPTPFDNRLGDYLFQNRFGMKFRYRIRYNPQGYVPINAEVVFRWCE
jgi:hypothetical protein